MKLTEDDRELLAALGPEPTAVGELADAVEGAPDALADRLAEFADNGLVQDVGDGRYRRTESGRRLIVSGDGRTDERVDTSPDVESALAATDLGPEGVEAVRGTYAFLRYWGEATGDEIVDAIYPEWPAGFAAPEPWWETVRDALATLPEVVRVDDAVAGETTVWRYAGTPEASTPGSDGFLPSERRGHRLYGSVKHALESLDLSAEERRAVRAAFGVLRRRGAASEDEVADAVYADHPAGYDSPGEWWRELVGESFAELPNVAPATADRWRYDQPPTE